MTITLQDAINAIQGGELAKGKALLAKVLQQDPNNTAAWIWMSGTVEDIDQRRYCLEKALEIDPENAAAKAGLARMGVQPPNAVPPSPLARMDHGLGQPSASETPPAAASTPAFVWPEREQEDDEAPIVEETFIGDIVAAMNKDEPSSAPAQDTDLNWLFDNPDEAASAGRAADQELREMFNELEPAPAEMREREHGLPGGEQEAAAEQDSPGFSGLLPDEMAALSATNTPGQMWADPSGRSRRVTILTDRYLIAGRADPAHLGEIEAMLQTGQFPRRLVGHNARFLPVEKISSLQATPDSPSLQVTLQHKQDKRRVNLTLGSAAQRDELVEAFKTRFGEQFKAASYKTNLWDTLETPGFTLMVLALITGGLYFWTIDLLDDPSGLTAWLPANWTSWLTSEAAVRLPLYVVAVGGGLMLLAMVWLLLSLRRPSQTLVVERKAS